MIAVPHYIDAEEYLAVEQQSQYRHEYRYGLVYTMAGRTDNHDRIAFNLLKLIDNRLGNDSTCQFYSGNVKVNYQDKLYYYPDAFVTCDARDRQDRYIKRYPKLIAEVLSSSTQAFDKKEKFEDYQQLGSLEEYVLISQTQRQVDCRRRRPDGRWETETYSSDDIVKLESIGLEFAISDLYRGLNQ